MNSQGNGLVAWISTERNQSTVHSVRFQNGIWGSTFTLANKNWIGGGVCSAMDGTGQALVSWTDYPTPAANIPAGYSALGDPGGGWTSALALPVNAATPEILWPMFLTPDGQGGFWGGWTCYSVSATAYTSTATVGRFSAGTWGTPYALPQAAAAVPRLLAFNADPSTCRPMAMTMSLPALSQASGILQSYAWDGSAWRGPILAGQAPSGNDWITEGTLVKIGPNQALSGLQMRVPDPGSPYIDKTDWMIWSSRYN
jgi:hypothetical protein